LIVVGGTLGVTGPTADDTVGAGAAEGACTGAAAAIWSCEDAAAAWSADDAPALDVADGISNLRGLILP
jgi:hypothetical protein